MNGLKKRRLKYLRSVRLKGVPALRPSSSKKVISKYGKRYRLRYLKGLPPGSAIRPKPGRPEVGPAPPHPAGTLADRVTACYQDCARRYPDLGRLTQRQACGRPCEELARSAAQLSLNERVAVCRANCAGRSFGPMASISSNNCNLGCNLLARSGGEGTPPGTSSGTAACQSECRRRHPTRLEDPTNRALGFCLLNCTADANRPQSASGCPSWSRTVTPGCLAECRRLYRGSAMRLLACSAGCGIAARLARPSRPRR